MLGPCDWMIYTDPYHEGDAKEFMKGNYLETSEDLEVFYRNIRSLKKFPPPRGLCFIPFLRT